MNNIYDQKEIYSPPKVEVIEVIPEKGYANSINDFNPDEWPE